MNNAQLIQQGNDAESLLKSDTFISVVNTLVDQCMLQSLQTQPEQKEKRENLYYQSRGLQEIVSTLNQMVAVRDQILYNTQEDN